MKVGAKVWALALKSQGWELWALALKSTSVAWTLWPSLSKPTAFWYDVYFFSAESLGFSSQVARLSALALKSTAEAESRERTSEDRVKVGAKVSSRKAGSYGL